MNSLVATIKLQKSSKDDEQSKYLHVPFSDGNLQEAGASLHTLPGLLPDLAFPDQTWGQPFSRRSLPAPPITAQGTLGKETFRHVHSPCGPLHLL